jgi:hypothetical protein
MSSYKVLFVVYSIVGILMVNMSSITFRGRKPEYYEA